MTNHPYDAAGHNPTNEIIDAIEKLAEKYVAPRKKWDCKLLTRAGFASEKDVKNALFIMRIRMAERNKG